MGEVSLRSKSFHLSPPIRVDGGYVVSLRAPLATIAAYAAIQEWDSHNIVVFGQNGAVPGLKKEDIEAHMIVIKGDHNMSDVAGSIDKSILHALLQDEFDYANMIAGFHNGVQVVNFGCAFATNPFGEYITDVLFNTFFDRTNLLKRSHDLSNTLLFIGGEKDRTLCAKIAGRDGTYKMLPSPYAGVVESRHAVVGKNILLTASFDQKDIYAIDAESLVDFLSEPESVLVWSEQRIAHNIEDIAVVDGSPDTVILTLSEGSFRLMPITVRFEKDDLVLRPGVSEGICLADLGGEILSPVVRIAWNGHLVLADRHNTSTLLRFDRSSNFGQKFEDMISRATSHQLTSRPLP
ncbi:hypothetical protein A2318_03210 [Candidatus Uhrbacteria bacterium RIFOXYB2_FULL_45_11]|uniref:Uncharacterized protein n=1 Tax=Candidatus Uhrbacteria bacterium RIFOXYB2_FULL_45_11 TaxID=1802421 RepID=A0A1F7WA80_9BACT|nr:MAG: hypothetical protein A2318_03210 [Candidatus Uhrbacteria bacterium RIFOXYB2_FULL_45_11]